MIANPFGTDLFSCLQAASKFAAALAGSPHLVIADNRSFAGIGPATGLGVALQVVTPGTGYFPGETFVTIPVVPGGDPGFHLTVTSVDANGGIKTLTVTTDANGNPLPQGVFLTPTSIVAAFPDSVTNPSTNRSVIYGQGATFKQGSLWQFQANFTIITASGKAIAEYIFSANGIGAMPANATLPAGTNTCSCPFATVSV